MSILTKYSYTISTDFPNSEVDSSKLAQEIQNSLITTALQRIDTDLDLDLCDVWFHDVLSAQDKIILDGNVSPPSPGSIIGSHDGEPPLVQDSLSGMAEWVGTRYYAIDYDNGLDSNLGYSDIDMPTAGTVAIRTLGKLRSIFPRNGNGQKAVIAIRARAGGAMYRNIANTADDELQLLGIHGYQHLLVRGTGTVATASATAFANDANDKICLGSQIFAGTNAAGYNPTGSPSVSTFTCRLNGGGSAGLASEPTLLGKRIRFSSTTTTVALRNICTMIHENSTATITVATDLPAVPALTDVFYIEEPSVSVDRIQIHGYLGAGQATLPLFTANGLTIAGIRMPNTTAGWVAWVARSISATFQVSFCDAYSPGFSNCTWGQIANPTVINLYTDELDTVRLTGVGFSCDGWGGTVSNCLSFVMSNSVCRLGRWQILNIGGGAISIGGGCYFGAGLLFQNCQGSGATSTTIGGNIIGNGASSTIRRLRLISGFSTACLSITNTNSYLRGIRIENVGALSMIECNGVGLNMAVNDVIGSTGNTGIGFDLFNCRDSNILIGNLNVNTFTATAGQDIRCTGPVYYTHADYGLKDLTDAFKNHIQGSSTNTTGSAILVTNDGNANIGKSKIVRATATGVVRAAQADSAANATGVIGVSQSSFTAAGPGKAMVVVAGESWVEFDSTPTVGSIAYLSITTAGNAQASAPSSSMVNQKLRLGRVLQVATISGLLCFDPDILPVLADGSA